MKDSITLSIPKPCHEKWDDFTPTARGGFCNGCQKEVVDFTVFTEAQLLAYLTGAGASLCGRFRTDQLKTYPLSSPKSARKSVTTWAAALGATLALTSSQAEAGAAIDKVFTEVNVMNHAVAANSLKSDTTVMKTVTGIVRSSLDSLPISQVSVVLKNSLQEVTTDSTGRFTMVIAHPKPDDTLIFNRIGFYAIEQRVPATGEVDVMIDNRLDEILVVAGGIVAVRRCSPRNIWLKLKNVFR